MERKCVSCGADPGAGSFCQHCGARQPDAESAPAADQTPAAPPPEPSPPPPPPPQQPAQQPSPKRRGLGLGCLIVAIVVLGVVGVGGYIAWNFVNDEVLPGLEDATEAFSPLSESPPGPCFDIEERSGVLTGFEEVSCDGPRQAEVSFAALFEDGPFPGDQHLVDSATATCLTAFENYVGISPEQSAYDVDWMVPNENLWTSGVRNGICLVVTDDGSVLNGTVKGSNR